MSDSEDDLFVGAPTFKSKIRTEQAKQNRSINYLDKVLENTLEKKEQRERIESLMRKNDEFAASHQTQELMSVRLHDSVRQGGSLSYRQFDDNDEAYWNNIESMALVADENVHKRDKRRRDLEDLIDGYNDRGDTFKDDNSSPLEVREKRQALIHSKQVGTSSHVGRRRVFGYVERSAERDNKGIFIPYDCIEDAMNDLNEIINFHTSSLDTITKEKFETFKSHIFAPIQRGMVLNCLHEVLGGNLRNWFLDIPYAAEFRQWLIRVGISGMNFDANLSISSFEFAKSMLLKNTQFFNLNIPHLNNWSETELSLTELERMFSEEFGMYMSSTVVHETEDSQDKKGSALRALTICHTLRLWEIFIKKGHVLDEGFLASDRFEDCTAMSIIRDLFIAYLDPVIYNDTYACTALITTIFDHISVNYNWDTLDNMFPFTTVGSYTEKTTGNWQNILSTMIVEKVSKLPKPCLPLALIVRSVPLKEKYNVLLFNFAPHLFFASLSYCFGEEVANTLKSKIQKTSMAFVQDIDDEFDQDEINLRFEMVAMSEVGLRELLRNDEVKCDSEKFLAIVDISSQCVELAKQMSHHNIANYSMKSSVGGIYQSISEAAAMFHFYGRLIDLCTTLKRSITSVISDSNLRRVKELLNFLLTYYGEEKRNASLLAKISSTRQPRQSSLMNFIQMSSLEGELKDEDQNSDSF